MRGRLVDYHDELINMFRNDRDFSMEYLSHILKNKNPHRFLETLSNLLEAHVGTRSVICRKAKVNKEEIEDLFSDKDYPEVNTLIKLLNLMKLQFSFIPLEKKETKKAVAIKATKKIVTRKKKIVPRRQAPAPSEQNSRVGRQLLRKAATRTEKAKSKK